MPTNPETMSLEGLAGVISSSTATVCDFLRESGNPEPSFALDGPKAFPTSAPATVVKARADLINASRQLQYLALYPTEAVGWHTLIPVFDTASLHWLTHFRIPQAVPLVGSIPISSVAETCNVDEAQLVRILRHAMTNQWFCELKPGHVAHSAMSSLMVTNEATKAQLNYQLSYNFPCAHRLVEATELSRSGGQKTAFNLAFDTSMNSAQWAGQEPDRAAAYSGLMKTFQRNTAYSVDHVVNCYDWTGLGPKAHVVDVGGNTGDTAIALARAASNLTLTCQDLPDPIEIGKAELPSDLKDRITLQAHDFLTPNPVKDADIYLLRFILHDWPDEDAITILRNLSPNMKPDSKLLIADSVVGSNSDMPPMREKMVRHMDILMMAMFGAKERTESEWRSLIEQADSKLSISRIIRPEGSVMALIELVKS